MRAHHLGRAIGSRPDMPPRKIGPGGKLSKKELSTNGLASR
jgi:hypothetical protein